MSMKVLTTALAAFACAAVVSGQAPPPQQPPAPNAPPIAAPTQRPPDQKAADSLTVTGCLERRTANSIATPGPAGGAASNEAPGFMLTKVMKPTGTAGSSAAAPAAASYRLDADDSKLSSHVGEKVEIRGTLADRSANPAAGKSDSADAPRLKVENVKMIASSCTE